MQKLLQTGQRDWLEMMDVIVHSLGSDLEPMMSMWRRLRD